LQQNQIYGRESPISSAIRRPEGVGIIIVPKQQIFYDARGILFSFGVFLRFSTNFSFF
jgi:hypothetical protein